MSQQSCIKVFYSYAHTDEGLRQELNKHLAILKRSGVIETWSDTEITAGAPWEEQIARNLREADIILLLISPDFLASEYCWNTEMDTALKRHNNGTARVIPVFLRPCLWKGAAFGTLQGLPTKARPITEWNNLDAAFTSVAEGIEKTAKAMTELKKNFGMSIEDEFKQLIDANENATNTIMECAENIDSIVSKITEESLRDKISNEINGIFEAASFQDITTQRLMRLVNHMSFRGLLHLPR